MVSLLILAVLCFAIAAGPLLLRRAGSMDEISDNSIALQPPSPGHWFGTDHLGRDLFARVLHGGRYSLPIGLIVVSLSVLISLPLGTLAGFWGGWLDEAIMRLTDVFLAVPQLLLALLLATALGAGFGTLILALTISWWPWYVRLMRAQTVALREREYVIASQALGADRPGIAWRHVLPNAMTPILVQATSDLGAAILAAAALSFLGLGVPAPATDWGQLVSDGRVFFPDRWWYTTFPGAAIFLAALSFGLLGDSLHAAIDPRLGRLGR
jgi:peptide/nickel transport system permease protein